MQKAWNPEKKFFAQSYDEIGVLDSAVLIMPLVFFATAVSRLRVTRWRKLTRISKSDPRFRSTLDAILKSPERGGLTANVGGVARVPLRSTDPQLLSCRTSFIATTQPSLTMASVGRRVLSVFALYGLQVLVPEAYAITTLHAQVHRSPDSCRGIRQGCSAAVNSNV